MFHPRVSFASCIKLGSLTCNKETLLLQTYFPCSILSPLKASTTSSQILLRQVESAVGTEFIVAGGALVAPSSTDSTWRQGCPSVAPAFGACGSMEWHRHLLLRLGLLLPPAIPLRPRLAAAQLHTPTFVP